MAYVSQSDESLTALADDPFLLLHYTALCNASCAHCVVEGGPQRKERMSMELARELIDGARRVPGLKLVVFSGGESFIYLDDVLMLCAAAREYGLQTRVISNAYWARTPERAAAMLERLVEAGLDQLVISFSEFHREFIPMERVRNVFLGAKLAARAPFVAYSMVNTRRVREDGVERVAGYAWPRSVLYALTRYGFEPAECVPLDVAVRLIAGMQGEARETFKKAMVHERALINWAPLALAGRAAKELRDRVRLLPISEQPGPSCPAAGQQITAVTSGRVYPCCSTWTNYPAHAMGTAQEASDVPALVDVMQRDPLVRFIHERGPGPLIQHLRARGAALAGEYADICHMCQSLFERFSLEELRGAAAHASGKLAAWEHPGS